MADRLPYITLRVPRDLVSVVRTALEARAKEFEHNASAYAARDGMWGDALISKTRTDWAGNAAGLRKLAGELK